MLPLSAARIARATPPIVFCEASAYCLAYTAMAAKSPAAASSARTASGSDSNLSRSFLEGYPYLSSHRASSSVVAASMSSGSHAASSSHMYSDATSSKSLPDESDDTLATEFRGSGTRVEALRGVVPAAGSGDSLSVPAASSLQPMTSGMQTRIKTRRMTRNVRQPTDLPPLMPPWARTVSRTIRSCVRITESPAPAGRRSPSPGSKESREPQLPAAELVLP